MTRKQSHTPTHPAGEETRKNEKFKSETNVTRSATAEQDITTTDHNTIRHKVHKAWKSERVVW